MPERFRLEAVELQIDLDAVVVTGEEVKQLVAARDLDAVRVDEDADDVPLEHALQQLEQPGVHRGLAPADHQHVQPAVLAPAAGRRFRAPGRAGPRRLAAATSPRSTSGSGGCTAR